MKRSSSTSFLLCTLVALLLAPASAIPCAHTGGLDNHDVPVMQADQQAVIIYDQSRQDLLIQAGYESDEEPTPK